MGDPLPFQAADHGQPEDFQIEAKTPFFEILLVESHLDRDGQIVTAVHLRPPGDSGLEPVNALLSPQGDEIVLVEQCGSRPDKAHVACQHAVQLGNLVQAELAQKLSDGGDPAFRVFQKMGGDGRGVRVHGPELGHQEEGIVATDSPGPMKYRALGCGADDCGDHNPQ